jgi:superfamily I DNA/RNA helicase
MPILKHCRIWQNDWLLVDEAQDINPARRALARKMLQPNGRAIFVGDRHQAIYGFTGADADGVDRVTADFRCTLLPLTVTYRCPKAVVAAAQEYVDHIEAHSTAPAGLVRRDHEDSFPTLDLGPEDAILCRLTRPLVATAFKLIRAGTGCHVEGRDIGAGLMKLAERWAVDSIDALRDKLEAYLQREVEKLEAKGQETKAEAVQDRVDTLLVLMEGCKSFDDLRTRIQDLFADSEDGHSQTLTLSTVHKSKGREWDRVFVLGFDQHMPSRWARQAWQQEQELNLIYVAFTRAKRELVLVDVGDTKPKSQQQIAEETRAERPAGRHPQPQAAGAPQ